MDTPNLSKQNFEQQLNAVFTLKNSTTNEVLTLAEVSPINSETTEQGRKEPFSAIFKSNSPNVYEQNTYVLQNEMFGEIEVFLVPITADDKSVSYEAVFT